MLSLTIDICGSSIPPNIEIRLPLFGSFIYISINACYFDNGNSCGHVNLNYHI